MPAIAGVANASPRRPATSETLPLDMGSETLLLDTGPLSAYFLRRPAALHLIEPWVVREEATTSILVYAEIVDYLRPLPDFARRKTQLRRLCHAIYAYELSYPDLDQYVEILQRLRRPNGAGLIGDMDTLIAATAVRRGLTLVTMDRTSHGSPVFR